MTLRKISILSAAAFIAVTGMVQAAVTPPMHITIEYEYARDGEIVSRTVNGKVQRYAYDRRGQLTGIYDADGQAVEAYMYDAAGNILKKTINGKTTTFTYDAANQLVSKQDEVGTTSYEYDAAGRMIREGDKEYRYSYLDKITSVIENGETAATMDYFVGGQLASVTRGHEIERFIWDGLALVHRDGSDYLNEPAVGGGNPIASGGQVMFNDMLGSTVAVKGDENYSLTSMTAFGESSDSGAFFTGKPFIGEIGYAFLMRSYRPEHGKWQTADPIGYPDGWNQLAYCNNHVTSSVDLLGCSELFIKTGTDSRLNRELYNSDPEQFISMMSVFVAAVGFAARTESLPTFNIAGFNHWLNKTSPGSLPWDSFDTTGNLAQTMTAYFENEVTNFFDGDSFSSLGAGVHNFSMGGLDRLLSAVWERQSFNYWINYYHATINLNSITVTVGSSGSWYIDVCADLWAFDVSKFVSGLDFKFFGLTFQDDDFNWLMNNVMIDDGSGNQISRWGKDYNIQGFKPISIRIME